MVRPETIENQWDVLYRDYADVYEAFSRVKIVPVRDLGKMFGAQGKIVVDIGSGTGRSSFPLARLAKKVIGVEPEDAMRRIAEENLRNNGLQNVVFKKGSAESIPLDDKSADMIVSLTGGSFSVPGAIQRFTTEAQRVLAEGGSIFVTRIAPGWYGGELASEILGGMESGERIRNSEKAVNSGFVAAGYSYRDYGYTQLYDSLEHIVSTYGFIFGKRAIEFIKAHNKTSIEWKYRLYQKKVT